MSFRLFVVTCAVGGSSGTYSAIRLKQMGYSVTLIEQQNRLGGHVETYRDSSGRSVDYGSDAVSDYLAHFDVPLAPFSAPARNTVNVFFANASLVPSNGLTGDEAISTALVENLAQLARFTYLSSGFDLPLQVPSDLLLTWGEFFAKFNLNAIAPLDFLYSQDKALEELGNSVLFGSCVARMTRTNNRVDVLVDTLRGRRLIKSSKLLMTVPPKQQNLDFMDFIHEERTIFGQFNSSYYWTAIMENMGIPPNTSAYNVDPSNPYGIPRLPGVREFGVAGIPGLHKVFYDSPYYLTDATVQKAMVDTVAKCSRLVAFKNHSPFKLTGFYARLQALQGKSSTWWTGASWESHDSLAIWDFTETRCCLVWWSR
ncbi:hypothetical protein K470DRAFT_283625 [Piedraia hortae CBS 480.64]|uniref:FAD/NAD(P)-binding domain-containing protein n=1 Tax=Piedraia hortae CBS 480.64 TaxID=1314780 RepID=A0A6A7BRB3_9PEZI|nr:hypothetical protein K470DRAFT_283625 [Piedraia hortae CBS 480.64]